MLLLFLSNYEKLFKKKKKLIKSYQNFLSILKLLKVVWISILCYFNLKFDINIWAFGKFYFCMCSAAELNKKDSSKL